MTNHKRSFFVAISLLSALAAAPSARADVAPRPEPIVESNLVVRVDYVGTMPVTLAQQTLLIQSPNLGSPVPIGEKLYLLDQNAAIYRLTDDGKIKKIFDATTDAPDGLLLTDRQRILNIAPGSAPNKMYVIFTSDTPPRNVPIRQLPQPLPGNCCDLNNPIPVADLYRIGPLPGGLNFVFGSTQTDYQVVYEYKVTGNKLKQPKALAAFEVQSTNAVHTGGGATTLPDGRLLFATGDSLPYGTDGRAAAQDPNSHLSSLLLIGPDKSVQIAAKGVRNVQHIELSTDEAVVRFSDIGGVTAEEMNQVSVADLVDTSVLENFGWGRNPDGNAREGTFYLGSGVPLIFDTQPPARAFAPSPEAGFFQPFAQWGRTDPNGGVAATGPVTSDVSFSCIEAFFSDLSSGKAYASLSTNAVAGTVYRVNLVTEDEEPLDSFRDLIGGLRADPRFFRFPDGTAGVLLESTGSFYRLTEITE